MFGQILRTALSSLFEPTRLSNQEQSHLMRHRCSLFLCGFYLNVMSFSHFAIDVTWLWLSSWLHMYIDVLILISTFLEQEVLVVSNMVGMKLAGTCSSHKLCIDWRVRYTQTSYFQAGSHNIVTEKKHQSLSFQMGSGWNLVGLFLK